MTSLAMVTIDTNQKENVDVGDHSSPRLMDMVMTTNGRQMMTVMLHSSVAPLIVDVECSTDDHNDGE